MEIWKMHGKIRASVEFGTGQFTGRRSVIWVFLVNSLHRVPWPHCHTIRLSPWDRWHLYNLWPSGLFWPLLLPASLLPFTEEMSLWVQLPVCTEGLAGGESCQRRRGGSSSEKSLSPSFLRLRWAVAPVCLQQRLIRWGDTTPVKVWSQTQVFWGWRAMSYVNAENEEGTENIILVFFSSSLCSLSANIHAVQIPLSWTFTKSQF